MTQQYGGLKVGNGGEDIWAMRTHGGMQIFERLFGLTCRMGKEEAGEAVRVRPTI